MDEAGMEYILNFLGGSAAYYGLDHARNSAEVINQTALHWSMP
jgi:hypothetical protein